MEGPPLGYGLHLVVGRVVRPAPLHHFDVFLLEVHPLLQDAVSVLGLVVVEYVQPTVEK